MSCLGTNEFLPPLLKPVGSFGCGTFLVRLILLCQCKSLIIRNLNKTVEKIVWDNLTFFHILLKDAITGEELILVTGGRGGSGNIAG